jgi:LL-diaminopimelate aminotransferase
LILITTFFMASSKFNPLVTDVAPYPMGALSKKKSDLIARGVKVYDFGTGDPIEPTWQGIRDGVAQGVPVVSQYPHVKGIPELRKSISSYLKRRFGVDVDAETEILPCSGSKEAIYNVHFLLVNSASDKRVVIAPVPGYAPMERGSKIAGAEYYPVLLNQKNKFLLELADIPESVLKRTAMAWINYPHNPSGVSCDVAYLKRQVDIANKYGFVLCSDECYADIYFDTTPPPSALQVSKQNVLAFHSCSKRSGMTAYRSGFVAGDPELIKLYTEFRNTIGATPPVYTQSASVVAWNDDKHVVERCEIFRQKQAVLTDFLKAGKFEFVKSNTAFFLWVKAPGGSGKSYSEKLLEHGIIVSPGEFFGAGCEEYFRIALVPDLQNCIAAVKVWGALKL